MSKRNSLQFTDDDLDAIAELLRIAQQALIESADAFVARFGPQFTTSHVEYLRRWAERAADLREAIDAR